MFSGLLSCDTVQATINVLEEHVLPSSGWQGEELVALNMKADTLQGMEK